MNPSQLPVGHVLSRRLALAAFGTAFVATLVWCYVAKVQTGDVMTWYYRFKYEQDGLSNTLFNAWKFPWE